MQCLSGAQYQATGSYDIQTAAHHGTGSSPVKLVEEVVGNMYVAVQRWDIDQAECYYCTQTLAGMQAKVHMVCSGNLTYIYKKNKRQSTMKRSFSLSMATSI